MIIISDILYCHYLADYLYNLGYIHNGCPYIPPMIMFARYWDMYQLHWLWCFSKVSASLRLSFTFKIDVRLDLRFSFRFSSRFSFTFNSRLDFKFQRHLISYSVPDSVPDSVSDSIPDWVSLSKSYQVPNVILIHYSALHFKN